MVRLKVTVNDLRLKRRFERARALFSDLTPEMDKIGAFAIDEARRRLADRKSQVSIGRLGKSLVRKAFKRVVMIASSLPYALIQQRGGTVVPTKRKWLAIPIRLEDKRVHLWPKHVKDRSGVRLRFIPESATSAWLLYTKYREKILPGTKRKVTENVESYIRWRLLKRVKIPGNPYLVKSPALVRFMRQVIGDKIRRENRRSG